MREENKNREESTRQIKNRRPTESHIEEELNSREKK
jgi:hypothetical protein